MRKFVKITYKDGLIGCLLLTTELIWIFGKQIVHNQD